MKINRLLINITASVFTAYGLGFIFAPTQLLLLVTGAVAENAVALTDIRATYGGMSLAVGALLYVLASEAQTVRLGLVAVIIVMLCMAGGRIVGLVVDGSASLVMYIYLALELLAASAASFLLSSNRQL